MKSILFGRPSFSWGAKTKKGSRKTCLPSKNNGKHGSVHLQTSGPEVIKEISCSTQLHIKFFLLINVKMPTIVGM